MSYKNRVTADRDALFGSLPSTISKGKKSSTSSKSSKGTNIISATAGTTSQASRSSSSRINLPHGSSSAVAFSDNACSDIVEKYLYNGGKPVRTMRPLSGAIKKQKMEEAEQHRSAAKQAMTRGIFSRPDPVIAGTYYRKAAEVYKQCGENRLERLHRIASADCQRGQESYATAATEYARAAELVIVSDEKDGRKRAEAYQLYKSAADAWDQLGERGKAGEMRVQAAIGLLIGSDTSHPDSISGGSMDKKARAALEASVESHVPDPLNRFKSFRKEGTSAYAEESKSVALQNVVSAPYAHEAVSKVARIFTAFGEYSSALYASGAVTTLLEFENISTISLSRAFLVETILQLVLKDVVAADQTFIDVHIQVDNYLRSKECKLAEELIRAFKSIDDDALEQAKLDNRVALATLDPVLRNLVINLRIKGPIVGKTNIQMKDEKQLRDSEGSQNSMNEDLNELNERIGNVGLAGETNKPPEFATEIDEEEIDLR